MFGLFDKADVKIIIPEMVTMEETIDCTIEVVPSSDANLRKIEIELFCQETAISRGTSDTYYRKNVYSDFRETGAIRMLKGQPFKLNEVFKLPEFTTPTIYTKNHYVEWFVRVRLDVPWWPDTRCNEHIYVVPYLVTGTDN